MRANERSGSTWSTSVANSPVATDSNAAASALPWAIAGAGDLVDVVGDVLCKQRRQREWTEL